MKINFRLVLVCAVSALLCSCAGKNKKLPVTHSKIIMGAPLDAQSIAVLSEKPQGILQAEKAKPFRFKKEQNCRVFFAAAINATEPCLFSLNTASGMTFVNSEHPAYDKLFTKAKRRHVVDAEQAGVVHKDAFVIYRADTMHFGDIALQGVNFQFKAADVDDKDIFDRTALNMCGGMGTSALSSLVVTVDYPNEMVSFLPPALAVLKSTPVAVIPFSMQPDAGNIPLLQLSFENGRKAFFRFDTATSEPLLLNDATALDLDLVSDADGIYDVHQAAASGYQLGPVRGARTVQKYNVAGCGLFQKYKVTIDYPARRVYLENSSPLPQTGEELSISDLMRKGNVPMVSPF